MQVVSVIVPIYNVRKYIDKGIGQLRNQTYHHFEIILVDDGSTDGSLEVCQKWAESDNRIRVFHQANMGAGGARNLGITNAKGSYVYFYDIDDEISPNLLEYNVRIMESYPADMNVFGYTNTDIKHNSESVVTFPKKYIESNTQLRNLYVDEFVLKVNGFPWNKFYRKSFLDKYNLRYEDQRIQQDEVFNILCYHYVEKMNLCSEVLYKYYIYDKGNTRSRFIPERFDIYKSVRLHFENLKSFWKLDDSRLDDYLLKRFYGNVITCMLFNLTHKLCTFSIKEKRREMLRIMSDPLTIEAFTYADRLNLGFEQYLYRSACRNQNLIQIRCVLGLFTILRIIHSKIRTCDKIFHKKNI